MRVVCPLLHILPNGIRALAGDPLLDKSVILPGIVISLIWFVVGTIRFLNLFDKIEVKQLCLLNVSKVITLAFGNISHSHGQREFLTHIYV